MQKAVRTIILGPNEPSEGFRDLSLGHDPGFENPCVRHCVACLLNRLCGAGKLARNLARFCLLAGNMKFSTRNTELVSIRINYM
jgi:hypothetical protein